MGSGPRRGDRRTGGQGGYEAQACLCPGRSLGFTHGSSFLSSLTNLDNFGKPPPSVSVGKMHMKPHLELWVVFWDHRGSPNMGNGESLGRGGLGAGRRMDAEVPPNVPSSALAPAPCGAAGPPPRMAEGCAGCICHSLHWTACDQGPGGQDGTSICHRHRGCPGDALGPGCGLAVIPFGP